MAVIEPNPGHTQAGVDRQLRLGVARHVDFDNDIGRRIGLQVERSLTGYAAGVGNIEATVRFNALLALELTQRCRSELFERKVERLRGNQRHIGHDLSVVLVRTEWGHGLQPALIECDPHARPVRELLKKAPVLSPRDAKNHQLAAGRQMLDGFSIL